MRKVLAIAVGAGVVATALIANAQMQMSAGGAPGQMQGMMGMHMQGMAQMHEEMQRRMAGHMEGHDMAEHAAMMPGAAGRDAQAAPGPQAALPAAGTLVRAEIVAVDAETGRVTLRHEAIPNLDMRAMTMVFRVETPSLLEGLKAGDRVTFEAQRVNGSIQVTKIDKATATN